MQPLKSAYKALILVFMLFAVYLYFTSPEVSLNNVYYLILTLGCILLGFVAEKSYLNKFYTPLETEHKLIIGQALIILAIGTALRFYALNFGLPHNYHPDEIPKVNAVMRMYQQGSLDPDYFLHPSLLLYSTYFSNYLFHLFGAEGDFQQTAFLAGRTVSAIAGSLSVFLVYLTAKEVFQKRTALLASCLLAVAPIHITCSRYLKEDSLLVFFILLTTYFSLLALRKNSIRFLCLAGLTAGLSASTKYSGALSCSILVFIPWMKSGKLLPDRKLFIGLCIASLFSVAGFLAATPYSILNSAKFLKDVGYESRHMSKGHTTAVDAWSQYWMYHLSRSILLGTGLLLIIAGMFKTGIIFGRKNLKELFLVALLFMFYLSAEYVKSKPAPQPERYILPCIPFLVIIAAALFEDFNAVVKKRIFHYVCIFILAFSPLKRSLELASELKYDTRVQMSDWINQNIPAGAKFLTDRRAYAPLLDNAKYTSQQLSGSNILQDLDVKRLRKMEFDYLIISSLFYGRYFTEPNVEPITRQRIRDLSKYFQEVKVIESAHGSYGFHNPKLILLSLKPRS